MLGVTCSVLYRQCTQWTRECTEDKGQKNVKEDVRCICVLIRENFKRMDNFNELVVTAVGADDG